MTKNQTRQFKLKLREPNTGKAEQLEATLKQFRRCVNLWIEKIEELGEKPNRGNVHDYGYHEVKNEFPELYSNVVQECMNRAIEISRNKNGSIPEYTADSMSFKARLMRYDRDNIGIPVAGKERIWLPLIVPSYFGKYRELEKGRAQITYENDSWYALIAVEYPIKEQIEPEGVLGIDLGIRQIATVSTPDSNLNRFYGSELLSKRCEMKSRTDALMRKKAADNNAWKALKQVSGYRYRYMDDVNHKIASEIVELAKHYR